jgi:5'-nucleotidase
MNKKIVYVDMDFTLCDYAKGFKQHQKKFPDLKHPQSEPGLYVNLDPMPNAIEVYNWIDNQPEFDVYILTAPSIRNPHCYSEKRIWVEDKLGLDAVKSLIITPNKGLNKGDYLIDDNASGKGQEDFEGELILFGSAKFPDWTSVRSYLQKKLAKT